MVVGEARRVTDSKIVAEIAALWATSGWPAQPDGSGTGITAPFNTPTLGPPPWFVYEVKPRSATAVGTGEERRVQCVGGSEVGRSARPHRCCRTRPPDRLVTARGRGRGVVLSLRVTERSSEVVAAVGCDGRSPATRRTRMRGSRLGSCSRAGRGEVDPAAFGPLSSSRRICIGQLPAAGFSEGDPGVGGVVFGGSASGGFPLRTAPVLPAEAGCRGGPFGESTAIPGGGERGRAAAVSSDRRRFRRPVRHEPVLRGPAADDVG